MLFGVSVDAPSSHHYDFAIAIEEPLGLKELPRALSALRKEYSDRLMAIELLGDPKRGESVVLLRFSFSAYSAILRGHVRSAAGTLRGTALEPRGLPLDQQRSFYTQFLAGLPLKIDASKDPAAASGSFQEQMGSEAKARDSAKQVTPVPLESREELWGTYARLLVDGEIFVSSARALPVGADVRLQFTTPEDRLYPVSGSVVRPTTVDGRKGFLSLVTLSETFKEFFAQKSIERRVGRRSRRPGGKRPPEQDRFVVAFPVTFKNFPKLPVGQATNISRGGMFVRTVDSPPLRAKVELSFTIPGGDLCTAKAEVVHVVSSRQASGQPYSPGANLSFAPAEAALKQKIAKLIERYEQVPAKVLVVDDDREFVTALGEQLESERMKVDLALTGPQARQKLVQGLFDYEVIVLNLRIPGFDGRGFLERTRTLGGELELRVVTVAPGPRSDSSAKRPSGGDSQARARSDSIPDVVARVKSMLRS